jgi:hypothetical protein
MMELAALEESVELLYVEAIGGHVGVLGVPFPRDLVYHQVGVSETENPPNANLLGQLEPMYQGFVFGDVVRRVKVDLLYVLQLVPLGRGEDDASSQAPEHLGAIEVHVPVRGVGAGGRYWFSPQSAKKSAMI